MMTVSRRIVLPLPFPVPLWFWPLITGNGPNLRAVFAREMKTKIQGKGESIKYNLNQKLMYIYYIQRNSGTSRTSGPRNSDKRFRWGRSGISARFKTLITKIISLDQNNNQIGLCTVSGPPIYIFNLSWMLGDTGSQRNWADDGIALSMDSVTVSLQEDPNRVLILSMYIYI